MNPIKIIVTLVPIVFIVLSLCLAWWTLSVTGDLTGSIFIRPDVVNPIQGTAKVEEMLPMFLGSMTTVFSIVMAVTFWTAILTIILLAYRSMVGKVGFGSIALALYPSILFLIILSLMSSMMGYNFFSGGIAIDPSVTVSWQLGIGVYLSLTAGILTVVAKVASHFLK